MAIAQPILENFPETDEEAIAQLQSVVEGSLKKGAIAALFELHRLQGKEIDEALICIYQGLLG